jgi:mxaA protein
MSGVQSHPAVLAAGRAAVRICRIIATLVLAVQCAAITLPRIAEAADDSAIELDVGTPRDYGYVLGDTIKHTVTLELGDVYALDESSLPAAGRIDRWLELRPPRVSRGDHRVEITLVYQLIDAPDATRSLVVPRQTLRVASRDRSVPVFVPEWSFTAAPIVPAEQRGAAARYNLRPERLPPYIPLAVGIWRLAALLATLALVLAALAWLHFGVPWRARRARPFARGVRELRGLRGRKWDEARQREAFRIVHRALDRAAGRTLLPSNVDELFRAHPSLAQLREPIEALLADSRRLFFGTPGSAPPATLASMIDLCSRCRDLERAVP